MHIHITDSDTGRTLWTGAMCAQHCGLSTTTWRGYVRKGMPPAPVAHLDARTPLWDASEVRAWHVARPSRRGTQA
ncbi:hypothetical protein CXB45_03050 [Corynebacterium mastitidis]|uniref:Uncharacterized protein n=1 Tax=Corynebacterium mastitidis TaxID=161890 RepID=A0A2N0X8Y0_9CORY|nr:hypothetical protein CXB45_03050 [Corynebacterium mastitidis]